MGRIIDVEEPLIEFFIFFGFFPIVKYQRYDTGSYNTQRGIKPVQDRIPKQHGIDPICQGDEILYIDQPEQCGEHTVCTAFFNKIAATAKRTAQSQKMVNRTNPKISRFFFHGSIPLSMTQKMRKQIKRVKMIFS